MKTFIQRCDRTKLVRALPFLVTGFLYLFTLAENTDAAKNAFPCVLAMSVFSFFVTVYFAWRKAPASLVSAVLALTMSGIIFGYLVCEVYPVNDSYHLTTFVIALLAGIAAYLLVPALMKLLDHRSVPLIMLILTAAVYAILLAAGKDTNGYGTKAWLSLGGMSFQLTELAKPLSLLFYASVLTNKEYSSAKKLGLSTVLLAVNVCGSLAIREMGSFCILLLLHMVLIYVLLADSQLKTKYLGFLVLMLACMIPFFMMVYLYLNPCSNAGILHGISRVLYKFSVKVYERFAVLFRLEKDTQGTGFQLRESRLTLLTASLIGPSSVSLSAMPLPQSDVAFASFTALFGMIPACGLIVLYYRIFRSAEQTAMKNVLFNRKQAVVVYGAGLLILLQAMVNILGTCNLVPFTGVTLPLISYGSSSQMVTFILLAMILRVSEQDMKGLEKRPYTFGF